MDLARLNSSGAGDGIFQLLGVNTMTADAQAPKVASSIFFQIQIQFKFRSVYWHGAIADMVLTVYNRQHVLLFQSEYNLFGSSQIQDTIQNVNISS